MKIMAIITPIAAILGTIGAYYALPDAWKAAFIADVRAGDTVLAQSIAQIDQRLTNRQDSAEVCRIRSESYRIEMAIVNNIADTPEGARYGLLLRQQLDENTYRLEQLGRRGAKCAK